MVVRSPVEEVLGWNSRLFPEASGEEDPGEDSCDNCFLRTRDFDHTGDDDPDKAGIDNGFLRTMDFDCRTKQEGPMGFRTAPLLLLDIDDTEKVGINRRP